MFFLFFFLTWTWMKKTPSLQSLQPSMKHKLIHTKYVFPQYVEYCTLCKDGKTAGPTVKVLICLQCLECLREYRGKVCRPFVNWQNIQYFSWSNSNVSSGGSVYHFTLMWLSDAKSDRKLIPGSLKHVNKPLRKTVFKGITYSSTHSKNEASPALLLLVLE